ncbi:hypothetical protein PHMEG_00041537, partial [Phytophthora megakarya]
MRSHMSYDEALTAARTDAEINSHLDARHLISMLVRIIYWKSLDRTPWAKYVPSWCYKEAESKLTKALTSGETALARKGYSSLSDSEKWIVEVPGQGILSWRHRGILMKFPPGTANAVTQSFRFPDYAPNLAKDEDVQALRERWDPVAFKELMDTNLWDVMFEDRSKFLILH